MGAGITIAVIGNGHTYFLGDGVFGGRTYLVNNAMFVFINFCCFVYTITEEIDLKVGSLFSSSRRVIALFQHL